MPLSPPKYDYNETVYLRESAAMGFIEAYTVEEVVYAAGQVLYTLKTGVRPPNSMAAIGELSSGLYFLPLKVPESYLIDYCDALDLAIAFNERQLNNLQQMKNDACPTGTE